MLAAIIALVAGCAPSMPDFTAEDARLRENREIWASDQNITARDIIERKTIAQTGGDVGRRGPELVLRFSDGSQRSYIDSADCDTLERSSECIKHTLGAYLPARGFFLVERNFYEGGEALLIDTRTGIETTVSGTPYFGLDADLVLVIDDDDEAYGSLDTIQVWRRVRGKLIREWVWRYSDEHATDPCWYPANFRLRRWRNPDEVALEIRSADQFVDGRTCDAQTRPAVLRRKGGTWSVEIGTADRL